MRLSFSGMTFAGSFTDTLSQYAGQDTPQAIREKQKAIMTLIEKRAQGIETHVSANSPTGEPVRGDLWLQVYERLLSALSGKPKNDPMASLEVLERLGNLLKDSKDKTEAGQ